MCSYGVLSTIVKIAILKIILVTDNLVYSEAVDLQKQSTKSGMFHSGFCLEHLLSLEHCSQVLILRLVDGMHNAEP